jgi:DNA-binding transcriptional LysR family regulator
VDWDNLRFFLELARTGRLIAAAQRLDVDHTTVSRRILALEKGIGNQLFDRRPSGYRLTEAGQRLLAHAEAMENSTLAIEESVSGGNRKVSGHVRIGATEGFGSTFLAPKLIDLCRRHPNLEVDLLAMPRVVNLSTREADIAITLDRPVTGRFVVSKLTDYVLKLYAAPAYLKENPHIRNRDDLAAHSFVGYVDDMIFSKELRYMDEICRSPRIALRSTSIMAQFEATVAGAGLAILPAFMASRNPKLRGVLSEEINVIRSFWIFTHTELKDLARIKTVWSYLKEIVAADQDVLLGKGA